MKTDIVPREINVDTACDINIISSPKQLNCLGSLVNMVLKA